MDVELLSKMIKELIASHDMVGLPGVGTFVAEMVPASFSDKGYTINPPYRRLSFHPSRAEDSLLVELYAQTNTVPQDVAKTFLQQFLLELRQVLVESKTIVLPGLGRLRATKENNFFFVAEPDLDIYPEGFALKPISLRTHNETSPQNIVVVTPEPISEPELEQSPEPESTTVSEVKSEQELNPKLPDMPKHAEPNTSPASLYEPWPSAEEQSRQNSDSRRKWRIIIVVVLCTLALLVLVFFALAYFAPELIDSILYTKEELDILNDI